MLSSYLKNGEITPITILRFMSSFYSVFFNSFIWYFGFQNIPKLRHYMDTKRAKFRTGGVTKNSKYMNGYMYHSCRTGYI